MKKYIIYLLILVVGILLGWLFFGTSSEDSKDHNHKEVLESNQLWTCSMHPQIMQPEPGDCPICGMDLIPAESGSEGLLVNQFKLTENAMALANIQTTRAGKGEAEANTLTLSGKIAENKEANANQVSYVSGRIEKLYVNFTGEEVQKGQLLASIYSPELYAAQQELITAVALKTKQPELYKAVRNKLKLWKLTEAQINSIESSGKVIENFSVYATVSGTVTEKLVEEGDYVKQGQSLFKIANLSTVWANFDVYENQIERFEKGQEVSITTNAYPNREFKGKVDFIDPVLNTQTRTVTLRVVLNNTNDLFKPGMFVKANVLGVKAKQEDVLSIPASSVLWTGERSVVYVKVNPDQPAFEMREVTLGNRIGNAYEVLNGLSAGDEIVTNGTFTVDAAAQLQGKKSMMNKAGGNAMTGHKHASGTENQSSAQKKEQDSKTERLNSPADFKKQLQNVYESYIAIKDALAKDDTNTVSDEANTMLENLNQVDDELLSSYAQQQWRSLVKAIRSPATAIAQTTNLKEQRKHFKHMSSHLINAVQLFGVNEKVYVEFCPMADNNNGAYWLSKEEEVINPYFGSAMLTCGEVKQIIE